jgi:putative endonuclease
MGRPVTLPHSNNMDLARLTARLSRLWRSAPSTSEQNDLAVHRQRLGSWGEEQACRFLARKGYRILRRNYRARHGGEVDIVARHKPSATLCFIEVKTRASDDFGRPALAVDEAKQRLIVRGALSWLRLLDNPDITFRFDIVEVLQGPPVEIEHLENAFQLPEGVFY